MDMSGRERLHWLVDMLPESQLATADRVLTGLVPQPVHHTVPPPVHHPPAPPIRYTRWVKKDLGRLPPPDQQHILGALKQFVESDGMGDVRELYGKWRGRLRLRVGLWRVIFYGSEGEIVIRRVLHYRDPAYRNA